MNLTETTLRSEVKYKGRIINLRQDTVALTDGREALRDVVEHPGGVGNLPLDADGNAYMVRQYRSGVQDIVLEIPAGKLEYGEDPLECGRRELMEEIGARAERYTDLGRIYPTPAYCCLLDTSPLLSRGGGGGKLGFQGVYELFGFINRSFCAVLKAIGPARPGRCPLL